MSTIKQNPKHIQAQKDGKAPLEYLVTSMNELDAAVHKHGADKYGIRNWLIDEITASTYVGAMRRHLDAWAQGHDLDDGPGGSGKPHLTHLRACCAVVLDAQMHGMLIDDRLRAESKAPPGAEPLVKQLEKSIDDYVQRAADVSEARAILRVEGYPSPRCSVCKTQPCSCPTISL